MSKGHLKHQLLPMDQINSHRIKVAIDLRALSQITWMKKKMSSVSGISFFNFLTPSSSILVSLFLGPFLLLFYPLLLCIRIHWVICLAKNICQRDLNMRDRNIASQQTKYMCHMNSLLPRNVQLLSCICYWYLTRTQVRSHQMFSHDT